MNYHKMQPFPDISNATIFPLPESSWLEMKESFNKCITLKIRDTICALLNTGGGYIVIGVRDIDRYILGVDSDKQSDQFQLHIDDIYHQRIIVTEDGKGLPVGTLSASTLSAANDKKILVMTVKPEPGMSYKMRNGVRFYRLNASNYRLTTDADLVTREELNEAVKNAQEVKDREIHKLRSKLKEVQKDFLTLADAARDLDTRATGSAKEVEEFRSIVFDQILEKKIQSEKLLRRSWLCWLC